MKYTLKEIVNFKRVASNYMLPYGYEPEFILKNETAQKLLEDGVIEIRQMHGRKVFWIHWDMSWIPMDMRRLQNKLITEITSHFTDEEINEVYDKIANMPAYEVATFEATSFTKDLKVSDFYNALEIYEMVYLMLEENLIK